MAESEASNVVDIRKGISVQYENTEYGDLARKCFWRDPFSEPAMIRMLIEHGGDVTTSAEADKLYRQHKGNLRVVRDDEGGGKQRYRIITYEGEIVSVKKPKGKR